ncbi:MAG TPA: adenosylmethionine--8-amino-7-oxononanoate aminotransferase BioA, partial [Bacteroidetes bacterium]|nr:adenosylmethionine--8-amino-7-oxononanoate aminotransferase BioA [Bacteroidota bacterium]
MSPSSNIWKPFTISKVSPDPLTVKSGKGLYLELEDGRRIKDMISSWWVNLHGHA